MLPLKRRRGCRALPARSFKCPACRPAGLLFLWCPSPPHLLPCLPSLPCALLQGEVVEIVLQNLAANANNGDYRGGGVGANRTAQEQHPFHLHGHSFWVGEG
jgi:hypothetical protein